MLDEIATEEGGVLAELAVAIGCYIMPGDHIGECTAQESDDGEGVMIAVAYDPDDAAQTEDFERFFSRLREIDWQKSIPITLEKIDQLGRVKTYALTVQGNFIRPLARELLVGGGDRGFGSQYTRIRRELGPVLEKIRSGEGV